jgi:Flp pilus assembly pilin Flp
MKKIGQFLLSRTDSTAIGYAMIAALVSVVILTGAASVGAALNTKLQPAGASASAAH